MQHTVFELTRMGHAALVRWNSELRSRILRLSVPVEK